MLLSLSNLCFNANTTIFLTLILLLTRFLYSFPEFISHFVYCFLMVTNIITGLCFYALFTNLDKSIMHLLKGLFLIDKICFYNSVLFTWIGHACYSKVLKFESSLHSQISLSYTTYFHYVVINSCMFYLQISITL